jgi:opacity protein-like surface antigen
MSIKKLALTVTVVMTATAFSATAQAQTKTKQKRVEQPKFEEVFNPPLPPIWSGFYFGATVGYGNGTSSQTYDRVGDHGTATTSPSGFLAAATVGYNYMYTPNILIGMEGDLGLMNVSADDKVVFDGHVYKTRFGPWWATARGRLGYVSGNLMGYVTAGAAFMGVDEVSLGNTPGETATNASTRAGWVLGAGVEYALSSSTTAKFEYLHMDFGTLNGLSANREDFSFTNTVNIVRTGINFKF